MKILVLGATGMLGCYSALALKQHGHDVIAVGRRLSDKNFFSDNGIEYIGGIKLEDGLSFKKLPKDTEAVVHMAGAMPAHTGDSPLPYVQSIVVGIVNVLEWMKGANTRRIIFNTTPSDVCAYFGKSIPVSDDAIRSFPKDGGDHAVYAICKSAAVDILTHYQLAFGFRPIVFRHLTVYGWSPDASYWVNGQKRILPWRQIWRRAIKGQSVEVWGNPNRMKELLYVDDFTEAVCKAVITDVCGIYNLPGARPYSLEEQIDGIIEAVSPRSCPSLKIMRPDKPSTPENLLMGEKVKKELGWNAVITWLDACRLMRDEAKTNRFERLWGKMDMEDLIE